MHERGLLPGWDGPEWRDNHIKYDRSGAELEDLEAELKTRQPREVDLERVVTAARSDSFSDLVVAITAVGS